jgi:hypothetical protein
MKAKIQIEGEKSIEKKIIQALAGEVDKMLKKAAGPIKMRLRFAVLERIKNTPEYKSLFGGKLQAEFGLKNPQQRMEAILTTWVKSINVTLITTKKRTDKFVGGLNIEMIQGNFRDVIDLPEAKLVTSKGETLPWLEWLLLYGDKIIIRDYVFSANNPKSRTGLGVMMHRRGKNWRVPPEFSGTINNNFVTRALLDIDKIIDTIIEEEVSKVFK